MRLVRPLAALLVVLVAVAAAAYAVQAVEGRTDEARGVGPLGDRATAILDTFASGDHLYVAPESESLLTRAQQRRVERAAASADPEVYVALVGEGREAGYSGVHHLLAQLTESFDGDGTFLVWDGQPRTGYHDLTAGLEADGYLSPEMIGKKDRALLRFIDAADDQVRPAQAGDTAESDDWGGTGGGIAAGVALVLAGYATLMLVVGLVRLSVGRSFLVPGRWRQLFGVGS